MFVLQKSQAHHLLSDMLNSNQNSSIYKSMISQTCRTIQERTYWYFTQKDAVFLGNVYNNKVEAQALKNRISQITDEKMIQVAYQIISGSLTKDKQEKDSLQIKLDIKDICQALPLDESFSSQRSKQKIKAIKEDFQKFKEKMDEIKRRIQNKKVQKMKMEQQFKKSLQSQKRQEQRKQIKKKLENIKQNDEQRKKSNQKFKQFLKQFKKTKPLHVLMQEQYRQKVELPKIEESRQKLQMLSHKKKPTLQQINNHDERYMLSKASRPQRIIHSQTIDVSFKSHFYQLEEQKAKKKDQIQDGPQWDFIQKQKRYSQFVKDKIKPKVSKKLHQELQQNLSKGYVHYEVPDRSRIIEVGKNYLQYMRSLQKNKRSSTPAQPIQHIKQSRYINYLDELKTKSEHSNTIFDWERDLKDRTTSQLQKRQRLLMKSKQLEEKAMRNQQLVSNYAFGRPEQIIQKKKEIDQTLLSSIKAKVAILKNNHQP